MRESRVFGVFVADAATFGGRNWSGDHGRWFVGGSCSGGASFGGCRGGLGDLGRCFDGGLAGGTARG